MKKKQQVTDHLKWVLQELGKSFEAGQWFSIHDVKPHISRPRYNLDRLVEEGLMRRKFVKDSEDQAWHFTTAHYLIKD